MIILLLLLICIGAFGGLLAGLLGIGGGLVFVPALYFLLSDSSMVNPMLQAVATSLFAATLTGISSARAHTIAQRVNWDSVYRIAPAVGIGAVTGAWLVAGVLSAAQLQIAVGGLLLISACWLLLQKQPALANLKSARSQRWVEVLSSFPIGVVSAVMGIAGGTWLVPMQTAIGIPIHRAVATAAVSGVLLATMGAGFMIILTGGTAIQWYAVAPLCVASVLCAPMGAKLAHRLSGNALRRLFGWFLMGTSLLILGGLK